MWEDYIIKCNIYILCIYMWISNFIDWLGGSDYFSNYIKAFPTINRLFVLTISG